MTIEEIRQSDLLELYVLGQLSEEESRKVEGYLIDFPELQTDYFEIQRSMETFAQSNAISPSGDLQQRILDLVKKEGDNSKVEKTISKDSSKKTVNKKSLNWLPLLLSAVALYGLWFGWSKTRDYNALNQQLAEEQLVCDSLNQALQDRITLYESLNDLDNRTLNITPTDKFPETQLLFHINDAIRQNFIQVKNLPAINQDQAFQLWALKDGVAPIPLTVFNGDGDALIPVDFEDETTTYAITIEVSGGAQTPDLTNLIGTVGV